MGIVNQNAFLAADSIVMVTDVDDNSRIGLKLFMDLWEAIRHDLRKEDNVKALILNKADVRNNLTAAMQSYCMEDEELAPIFVPKPVRPKAVYPNAAIAKLPMCIYQNTCPRKDRSAAKEAAIEIDEVVDYLEAKGVF